MVERRMVGLHAQSDPHEQGGKEGMQQRLGLLTDPSLFLKP